MKNSYLYALLMSCVLPLNASPFTVCKSTYALCTTALCTAMPDDPDKVSCSCEVKTDYSAATQPCEEVKNTVNGALIYSRYFPVKSYATCTNDRIWAYCLDKPCLIDSNNLAKANCICDAVKNKGTYVIVTDNYDKSTCTTGIISSATVLQIDEITRFLQHQEKLAPYTVKVLNPSAK